MLRFLRQVLPALAIAGIALSASAFSLLGPYASDFAGAVWEVPAIGYNLPGDIGGPMDLGEEYRWNIRTITYGFDKSFLDYFGQRGVQEINKAVAILNSLPAVSRMSPSLAEFPENTRRMNYRAGNLGIMDLRTIALGTLVEEMGLASPERYVWTLRSRVPFATFTNYFVIMRSFDPVTLVPSPYVNGVLYTYTIFEFPAPPNPVQFSDAVESVVDPLAIPFTSVASSIDGIEAVNPLGGGTTTGSIGTGQFYTGLTRDDVGGLRYLFGKNNYNDENLLTGATPARFGSPWTPVGPGAASNTLVTLTLRPGVDKVIFKQLKNESLVGNFISITNVYTDIYLTNSHLVTQKYQRILPPPDILFGAADLGSNPDGSPVLLRRSATAGWANNSALNSTVDRTGPGVIQPTVTIYFSNAGPYWMNQFSGFIDQANNSGTFGGWASFDGTTNEPIIYPNGASIEQLEQMILSAGH